MTHPDRRRLLTNQATALRTIAQVPDARLRTSIDPEQAD
ncbi:hypothetical protein MBT84_39405 [Streptomyces sp. MBT84]|nr:hypothetical protein [Streptomyces sp. MBT84]